MFDLFVCLAHHHRLDGRQELRNGEGREPEGCAELQGRTHVPAEDSAAAHAAGNAQLSTKPLDQIPDLPAFEGQGAMERARAVRTNRWAGRAIVTAPAELPVGESGQAFFSASKMSAPAMYFV